jgi:hypothetical protein
MNTTHTQQFNENFRKRWTTEEEIIVVNNIKNFPDNLHEAFRHSERQLTNRKMHSIEQKYYNNLKDKYPNIISVGTSKGFSVKNTKNRANKSESQETPLTPKLKSFQRIAMEMMQLSQEDLTKLLNFFK